MRRLVVPVVAAMVLALVGCTEEKTPSPSIPAAKPQTAALDWVERMPADGPALVFGVDELRVTSSGWSASISLRNLTDARFEIPLDVASSDRAFGLMLFVDDQLPDVNEEPPPVRVAWRTTPATPGILKPDAVWRGTISAPGRLQSGAFVRVSFGPFRSVDEPPAGFPTGQFTWITDHAYRLR